MKKIKLKSKLKSRKSSLYGDLNLCLIASNLESSVVDLEGFHEVFESNNVLLDVLNDCAKTSLQHIDTKTLQYDIRTLPKLMSLIFGKYPYAVQHIVNDFLFPLTTRFIINYLNNNIQDSQDFMLMKEGVLQLPESIRDIILERSLKPVLISEVDQEVFINKLEIALGLIKSEIGFEDFDFCLKEINKYTNLFCGTSMQPTLIH
tara:strand:+ start:655 stop:1266 length:612 start_codon:yes stop_codon:yes gene_type:complete